MNAKVHLIDRWLSYIMYDDLLICLHVYMHRRQGNVEIMSWPNDGSFISEQETKNTTTTKNRTVYCFFKIDWFDSELTTGIMTHKSLLMLSKQRLLYIVKVTFRCLSHACMARAYIYYVLPSHFCHNINRFALQRNWFSIEMLLPMCHLWLLHICFVRQISIANYRLFKISVSFCNKSFSFVSHTGSRLNLCAEVQEEYSFAFSPVAFGRAH